MASDKGFQACVQLLQQASADAAKNSLLNDLDDEKADKLKTKKKKKNKKKKTALPIVIERGDQKCIQLLQQADDAAMSSLLDDLEEKGGKGEQQGPKPRREGVRTHTRTHAHKRTCTHARTHPHTHTHTNLTRTSGCSEGSKRASD